MYRLVRVFVLLLFVSGTCKAFKMLTCCEQAAMYGDGEVEPSKDTAVLLCWEACKVGLPLLLAQKLSLLDFETRKDAAQA